MAPLGQRILWRAVPVGVATTLVGYGLLRVYLVAARAYTEPTALEGAGPSPLGTLLFGLAGFAIMAVLECVRKPKPPKRAVA
jgi:hypothetical protein